MKQFESGLYFSVRYTALLMPLIVLLSLTQGGLWNYLGLSIIFGYYFLVELLLWATGLGIFTNEKNEFQFAPLGKPTLVDRYGVAVYGVMQMAAMPFALYLLSRPSITTVELVGGVLSLAVMIGSVGGLAGHEYMHRNIGWERRLGIIVYGCVHYAHFSVSHVMGHHRYVGFKEDWSTSRKNESAYHFLYRALVHGYIGAWRIETHRLRRKKLAFWSLNNFMLLTTFSSLVIVATIAATIGWKAVVIHSLVSLLSMCLMEIVNYLSHYGLTRERDASGKLAPVTNAHSWESNNKVTNWFIFNAGKHCHHHRRQTAEHHELELANENEFLPFGLPLMTLIAFCPPLYFALMNPMLKRINGGGAQGR